MTMKPLLELRDIRRSFSSHGQTIHAVNGISLTLSRGETLGIVGESGSGKSTLGRIAVGLDNASAGRILIDGVDLHALSVAERRERFRDSQMIFQDPYSSLNPRLTVGRQIAEGLYASGISDWTDIRERVRALFLKVGLKAEQANLFPHEFSGGQRQRIAIARALAPEPKIIVADEPVSALDVTIQAQILDLLRELQKQAFLSYMFISHDMAVVAHLCDRIAVVHRGRIVEIGPTRSIIENAQHTYTKTLLEAVPRFGRRRTGEKHWLPSQPDHGPNDLFETVAPEHEVLIHSSL
ncbi:ATP-binding cassette domain-containing protein [Rhizobium sp.]|jgi:ABC-type oligopeptide transport system ATPase subunit|uniref:ATP-binding cassette domain-containing protein n=1 Tax=Rhizobium sp. TaxID=391 RepID=UPI000E9E4E9D|nr:ABC transporter ATP-binding protein [Rhizobium sp.]